MPFKRPDSKLLWIRVRGVRKPSGTADYEQAQALEHKLNLEAWQYEKLGIKPPKSFLDVCTRWHKEKSGKSSWHDDYRAIMFWQGKLGSVPDVRKLTRELIDEEAHKAWPLTMEPSPVNNTANHYVGVLTAMLNAACREWDWIERSPKFRRYPIPEGRDRWLTVEEWRKLEAALPDHFRLPATFALATGMRLGKVFGLTWDQVNMPEAWLSFKGTRNKLGNTIPLNKTAMSVLSEARQAKVVHPVRVFTRNGQPMARWNTAWTNALEKAGIQGIVWHSLRHSWASWLAQRGVPEWARNRLGGWIGTGTVNRYSHLDLESLRPFAAQIDAVLVTVARIEAIQAIEPARVVAITG